MKIGSEKSKGNIRNNCFKIYSGNNKKLQRHLEDRAELRPIETSHAHTIGNQTYLMKIGSEKGKRKKLKIFPLGRQS